METKMTGLDFKIREMAARIRELREITQLSAEEMAQKTDVSIEEYLACENGKSDLNFAFIYRCALAFGVDVTDIIEGVSPTLKSYTVTRNGAGQKCSPRDSQRSSSTPQFKSINSSALSCLYSPTHIPTRLLEKPSL